MKLSKINTKHPNQSNNKLLIIHKCLDFQAPFRVCDCLLDNISAIFVLTSSDVDPSKLSN